MVYCHYFVGDAKTQIVILKEYSFWYDVSEKYALSSLSSLVVSIHNIKAIYPSNDMFTYSESIFLL